MSFKSMFIFVIGAAVGAGGMYLGMKKYFEKKAENEINRELDKIHGVKKEEAPEEKEPTKEVEEPKEGPNLEIYKQVLEKKSYDTISKEEPAKTMGDVIDDRVQEKKPGKKPKAPKKITQEEFDSTDFSKRDYLTYYADGILADGNDIVMDPTETMGAANLRSFKSNYDTMYVMNYVTGLMYEITYSNSNFSDISGGAVEN